MKNLVKNFLIFFIIFLSLAVIFSLYSGGNKSAPEVGIEVLVNQLNSGEVSGITVEGNTLNITLKDNTTETVKKEANETLSELVNNFGVDKSRLASIKIEVKENDGLSYWLGAILPFLLPFLLIGAFVYFMLRSVQGANTRAMMFGQSQAKEFGQDSKEKITFKDVAGVKEAKEELNEVVEFLRQPRTAANEPSNTYSLVPFLRKADHGK